MCGDERSYRPSEGRNVGMSERCKSTPPGNSDEYQNKRVAGKAIRKNMKTKARQSGQRRQNAI